ncbi:hypothetical protein FHS29_001963 [Saccharothrix tamanrassetensis]|uniref:Uncharacterized protein n=1 Tax=Saccharothrix tamanrassetensis TaxID=1051531 RepID=A0A841CA37_9PSEU|nr:hypothetical protein [Saccharothrix tamanrassetensis]
MFMFQPLLGCRSRRYDAEPPSPPRTNRPRAPPPAFASLLAPSPSLGRPPRPPSLARPPAHARIDPSPRVLPVWPARRATTLVHGVQARFTACTPWTSVVVFDRSYGENTTPFAFPPRRSAKRRASLLILRIRTAPSLKRVLAGRADHQGSPQSQSSKDTSRLCVIPAWPGQRQPPLSGERKRKACLHSPDKRGSLRAGHTGMTHSRPKVCAGAQLRRDVRTREKEAGTGTAGVRRRPRPPPKNGGIYAT